MASPPTPSVSLPVAVAQGVRFYSRLRCPPLPGETDPFAAPDGAQMARMLPVAAVVIATPSALVLAAGTAIGLPAPICATLTIIALTLSTGAFHEDGLADTADGFGGGATVTRRLEIMKDSRIGTFGGAALTLGLILRVLALGAVLDRYGAVAALTLFIAAAILSRVAGLVPLGALPSARSDGAGVAVGRPTAATLTFAFSLCAALLLGLAFAGSWPLRLVPMAIVAALAIAAGMTWLSHRLIGGQTGDVAGATQQITEACIYLLPLTSLFAGRP